MCTSQKHPLFTLFVLSLLIAASVSQFDKIWIDTSATSMMMVEDPAIPFLHDTLNKFGSDSVTLIYVKDRHLFSPEKLEILEKLVFDLEDITGVNKVESLFTVNNIRNIDGTIHNTPMMDYAPETLAEAVQVRKDSLKNPIIRNNLLSDDQITTSINIYTDHNNNDSDFSYAMAVALENAVAGYKTDFETIFQLGRPYNIKSQSDTVRNDQEKIFPFTIIIILLTLTISMRSFSAVILPVLTSGLTIILTFGFMGATGIPIGVLTSIIPALIVIIGSTEDTHILSEFMTGMSKTGDREKSVEYMANNVGVALVLTAFTTVAGFLSIYLNNIIVLKQFGITAAFSMFSNAVITFMLAPVYLRYFGPKPASRNPDDQMSIMGTLPALMLKIIGKHYKAIILSITGISFIFGLYGLNIKLDNNVLSFFKADSEMINRIKTVENSIAGTGLFYIRISGEKGDFTKPSNLAQVEKLLQQIKETEHLDKAITLNHFIKLINREMNNGNPDFYRIPESENTISEYLFLLHRQDIRQYTTSDYSELNILVRHHIYSSKEYNTIIKKLEKKASELLPLPLKINFTGEELLVNKAVDSLVTGQSLGIFVLLLVILTVIAILFKRIQFGLISLVPNILPVMVIFGLMAILDIPLNTGTCMVAVIALGLVADDTIHFIVRYSKEIRQTPDINQALTKVMISEFRPIFCTSISLALGFALLCLSDFVPIIQLGALSAVVMFLAIIADLLLTPALLLALNSTAAKKTLCLLFFLPLSLSILQDRAWADSTNIDENFQLLLEIDQIIEVPEQEKNDNIFNQLSQNLHGSFRLNLQSYFQCVKQQSQAELFEGLLNLETFIKTDTLRFQASGWLEAGNKNDTWGGGNNWLQDSDNRRGYAELNEIFFTFYQDSFNLFMGKIIFTNGISTLYSPADRYTPMDYHDPFDIKRLGTWALKTDYFTNGFTLTAAILPIYRTSKFPSETSRWRVIINENIGYSLGNTIPQQAEKKVDINFENLSYFIHLSKTAKGWDFFSSAFYGLCPNLGQGIQVFSDTTPYKEFNFAAGFSTTLHKLEFHGEGAYIKNSADQEESFISYDSGITYTLDDPSQLLMENIIFTIEYAAKWSIKKKEKALFADYYYYQDEGFMDKMLIYRLSMAPNGNNNITFKGFFSLSRSEHFSQIKWKVRIHDDFYFITALDNLSIKHPLFSNWSNNDRISIQVKYFF
jgi:uncharacterized protein